MKTIMKKHIIFIISILFAGLILSSCNDFLDYSSKSDLDKNKFWKTESDANAGVVAMYYSLSQAMANGCFDWGEIRGGNWAAYDRFGYGQDELINHAIPSTNTACYWTNLYQAVNRANLALKYIPGISMSPTTKNTYLGEAYAMRALCYFYIVRTWGNTPLFTTPVESFSAKDVFVSVTNKELILDLIQSDLLKAEELLPELSSSAVNKKRLTKPAVYALMMDVYAWRHQYDMVVKIMEEKVLLLNSSNWGLDTSIASNLSQTNFTKQWRGLWNEESISKEQIFTVHYYDLENGLNKAIDYFASGSQKVIISDDLRDSYATGDKRFLGSFDTTNSRHPFTKFWQEGTKLSGTGSVVSDVDLILYRYADLVLLYAEALNKEFRTNDAIAQLNSIRLRAGVSEAQVSDFVSDEELALAILHERRVELLGEGKYWFDLIRTGYVSSLGNCPDSRKWVFPIHRDHLLQNTKLDQNQGWN